MVSPCLRLCVALIVLALTATVQANGVAACEAAGQTLEQLQQEKQQQAGQLQQLQGYLNGQVPDPVQLAALLGHPLEETAPFPSADRVSAACRTTSATPCKTTLIPCWGN